ncbi:MAG: type II toxin-antitoxin system PrlF family antitoxin [Candidatus Protochlamydia sp.]|nr:type II toxin-antitoxin system PrlF family antitoxin [Candidatus Protochlamydia sp.]
MYLLISKLTSKYQATVPKKVRQALNLKSEDQIIYEILDNNTVYLRKAKPVDLDYLKALEGTLTEWNSEDDEKAYQNL